MKQKTFTITELLALARKRKMTDAQICKAAGKHKCTLWRWENGKSCPRWPTKVKLMKAIDA